MRDYLCICFVFNRKEIFYFAHQTCSYSPRQSQILSNNSLSKRSIIYSNVCLSNSKNIVPSKTLDMRIRRPCNDLPLMCRFQGRLARRTKYAQRYVEAYYANRYSTLLRTTAGYSSAPQFHHSILLLLRVLAGSGERETRRTRPLHTSPVHPAQHTRPPPPPQHTKQEYRGRGGVGNHASL